MEDNSIAGRINLNILECKSRCAIPNQLCIWY